MNTTTCIIFTQGGKGGVAKTEVLLSLIPWYCKQGIEPILLDFDIENTNKSGLQNFYPEARKFDVNKEGALDEFFDISDESDSKIIIADLGAGAGAATYTWFEEAFQDADELDIKFTSIGATADEAGAVQSVLKWATHLQDRTEYLVVLNELREPRSKFEYWHKEPAVKKFKELLSLTIITMQARIQEFQAELRNQSVTLQHVIDGEVSTDFLRKKKNTVRAIRYQRQLFTGFDKASDILI